MISFVLWFHGLWQQVYAYSMYCSADRTKRSACVPRNWSYTDLWCVQGTEAEFSSKVANALSQIPFRQALHFFFFFICKHIIYSSGFFFFENYYTLSFFALKNRKTSPALLNDWIIDWFVYAHRKGISVTLLVFTCIYVIYIRGQSKILIFNIPSWFWDKCFSLGCSSSSSLGCNEPLIPNIPFFFPAFLGLE